MKESKREIQIRLKWRTSMVMWLQSRISLRVVYIVMQKTNLVREIEVNIAVSLNENYCHAVNTITINY